MEQRCSSLHHGRCCTGQRALDFAVSIVTVRGLGNTTGLFVLALIAGNDVEDSGFKDGSGVMPPG